MSKGQKKSSVFRQLAWLKLVKTYLGQIWLIQKTYALSGSRLMFLKKIKKQRKTSRFKKIVLTNKTCRKTTNFDSSFDVRS